MNLAKISPYIRVAWDHTLAGGETILPRINYDYELVHFPDGKGVLTIESRIYEISPGDIFLIRPGVTHAIYPDIGSHLHQPHIHFDLVYQYDSVPLAIPFKLLENMNEEEKGHIRKDLLSESPYNLPEKIQVRGLNQFQELLYDLINEHQRKRAFYEVNEKAIFLRLLGYLLHEHERVNSACPSSERYELERIREYILGRLHTSLSLDELAREFNLSKYYLTRIFKNQYSISPIHYHQKARMEKIRENILYTNQSLTAIAEAFGYESVSVFSRAFRSSQGVAPSALRK